VTFDHGLLGREVTSAVLSLTFKMSQVVSLVNTVPQGCPFYVISTPMLISNLIIGQFPHLLKDNLRVDMAQDEHP